MGQRGKKSTESVVAQAQLVSIDSRLPPPRHLSTAQQEAWSDIINAMPSAWFTKKDVPLLMQLMQHLTNASNIQDALANFPVDKLTDPEYLKTYDRLTNGHERETRAITALYRTFRITQQSEYRAEKVRTVDDASKPWD